MTNRRFLFFLYAIVFLAAVAISIKWVYPHPKKVANFEQCAQAGYSVLQTYPPQCVTPSGQLYFKTIIEHGH